MNQQLTSLQGLSLENYNAQYITIEMLQDIDLQMFPPKKLHYLVHAFLNNTKLPSEHSMIRSEKRNDLKSGAEKADAVVDRERPERPQQNRTVRRIRPKIVFRLPNKFGLRPRPRAGNESKRSIGFSRRGCRRGPPNFTISRIPNQINMPIPQGIPMHNLPLPLPSGFFTNMPILPQSYQILPPPMIGLQPGLNMVNSIGVPPAQSPSNLNGIQPIQNLQTFPMINQPIPIGFGLPNLVNPMVLDSSSGMEVLSEQKNPNDENFEKLLKEGKLPIQIVRKLKKRQLPKQKSLAFKTTSPELIALKVYRTQAIEQIEKYRKQIKSDKMPAMSEKLKEDIPVYFQKKKASQKRRRKQKHELIKQNKIALYKIFGSAIYKRGWPISRKEIKTALGIDDEKPIEPEGVAEFLEMALEEKPLHQLIKNMFVQSENKDRVQTQTEGEKIEAIEEKKGVSIPHPNDLEKASHP